MEKLVGQNYTTPDLVAKVTGRAKYAEDYRADGMLFCKLLLSPMPHARVRGMNLSAALAMPGVKAILTADDLPDLRGAERALTNEPLYQGEPILAVAAVDELTAAEAIERIDLDLEPLPFVVDPVDSLRPGSPERAARRQRLVPGPSGERPPLARRRVPRSGSSSGPTRSSRRRRTASCRSGRSPRSGRTAISTPAFKEAALSSTRPSSCSPPAISRWRPRSAMALLAERQAVSPRLDAERDSHGRSAGVLGRHRRQGSRAHQRVHRRRLRQQGRRRRVDGDSGAALEEGQCARDDAHQPRGGALHRARAHRHGRSREGRLHEGRPHHRDRPLHHRGQRRLRPDGRLPLGRERHVADLAAEGDALARRRGAHEHAATLAAAVTGTDAGQRHHGADRHEGGQAARASTRRPSAGSIRPKARRCTARASARSGATSPARS